MVIIWNVKEKSEEICLIGHERGVMPVVFSSDCKFLVSGSEDKTIRVWNLSEKHEETCFEGSKEVFCVCVSKDSKFVASGEDDKTVRV